MAKSHLRNGNTHCPVAEVVKLRCHGEITVPEVIVRQIQLL